MNNTRCTKRAACRTAYSLMRHGILPNASLGVRRWGLTSYVQAHAILPNAHEVACRTAYCLLRHGILPNETRHTPK